MKSSDLVTIIYEYKEKGGDDAFYEMRSIERCYGSLDSTFSLQMMPMISAPSSEMQVP